jgi:O-antigen biosynthesis protein
MSSTANPAAANPAITPTVPPASATPQFAWQTCLDIKHSDGHVYESHFNPKLLESLAHPPRTLLDIGCSSGNLGAAIKAANPSCRTLGIEPNQATAKAAAAKLDRVICGKFEEVDFDREGIARGSIDTVVAADVLEHMYDPWHVMTGLKPYLSSDAQIIISIPNTRHLGLMKSLADDGQWTYAERGLLDITHIRFFTLKEMGAFLTQTGYRMEHVNYFLDPAFETLFAQNQGKAEINVRAGRLVFERLSAQELAELCTWQFFIRARPA